MYGCSEVAFKTITTTTNYSHKKAFVFIFPERNCMRHLWHDNIRVSQNQGANVRAHFKGVVIEIWPLLYNIFILVVEHVYKGLKCENDLCFKKTKSCE